MTKLDKAQADSTIDQLAHALDFLTRGRSYGIRVIATAECIEGLMQSDHPDRDVVIANIAPSGRIDGIL